MTAAPPADTGLASRQSLAHGPLGAALLSVERARRGAGDWAQVHDSVSGTGPLIDGPDAGLYLGAPAMAFVLHVAADGTDRYAGALHRLDGIVAAHTRRRLAAAHARIDAGSHATFAEYDLFRGLTGIGALLLRRQPQGAETKAVLEYLVRLTHPVPGPAREPLPGWWVGHPPATDTAATPGGHANAGMAHGITGPLALLALAMRAGITVDGHEDAIRRICRWLDGIRQSDHRGVRWPRWTTQHGPAPALPTVPSWCYGTPGLARAQQLAAIVLGDHDRKRMAERALLLCMTDPGRLDLIADRGLCHGFGGLLRTVQRVAQDADSPGAFAALTGRITTGLLAAAVPDASGFLEGKAGAALAFQDAPDSDDPAPQGQWDACLLLT
ncbi:lanthionine synthetase C family protein [Actinacidiphila acididurans]|uniref:Lanthionine synthetase C family protein n=1 Tax=Actinacidiphila acididurans TaxID=2784346 RepID=A0ABS2U0R3_9ACTN|nr:lanthionine synthetase C family protein [Actinacidiphila acididurans]MBM9509189.1 lanthionine synthetase C family protein [Actinacidiphila acididurans]